MLDTYHMFSDAQASQATTFVSTNEVDLVSIYHEIDQAVKKIKLVIRIGLVWTEATSGPTLIASLQDSADGTTYAETEPVLASPSRDHALLVAGYALLETYLPPGLAQYLAIAYTIGTATFDTAGTVNAYLTMD
jgi:hypothetical protein